jgi:tetratricopeptide (TPR) repeat protein
MPSGLSQRQDEAGPGRGAERWGPALAAVLVIAVYAMIACTAESELGSRTGAEAYYNRLVDGFTRGQLSLALEAPAGLAALPDPYDPKANARFHGAMYAPGRIHDLSYYRGRLYLYFSAIPALVLFLPWHELTGGYLSHQQACCFFCSVGFLASAGLAESIRRACFPRVGPGSASLATLCVGLVPVIPIVLERPEVWEVAITAAYAFWMLSLGLVWRALLRPSPSGAIWLGAGVTVALAIGCRPDTALGGAILLWPLRKVFRSEPSRRWVAVSAVAGPLLVIGGGLLAYNYARFGRLLEFGQRYQLSGEAEAESLIRHFDPRFLWYNFRLYFFEYPGWQSTFPFVKDLTLPAMPAGHGIVDNPVGVLTLLPFVLCTAAVPLAFRERAGAPRAALAAIAWALAVLFVAGAAPVSLYFTTCVRYQLEFVPALVLLAVIGFFALASAPAPGWRRGWLGAAGAAAAASIAFNLLMATNLRGDGESRHGLMAMQSGQWDEAIALFRRSRRLQPANVFAQLGLADTFEREGKFEDAAGEFQRAIVLLPRSPVQRLNYAYCLYRLGRWDEAFAACEAALQLQPDFPGARRAEAQIRLAQGRPP